MAFYPSKRRSSQRRKSIESGVSLTSMMDMMTILVLFLLKSYSAEGQLLNLPADLHLPSSTSTTAPRLSVQVVLTANALLVDGEPVPVDLKTVETGEEMIIPPLLDHLKILATRYEAIAARNETVTFTGDLILEADKEIPFRLLKKILYTSGQAGFINQSLAVYEKG